MSFRIGGVAVGIDPGVARTRILARPPDDIRTHWVELDGRRWPPKQALEAATGIPRDRFTSHEALRVLRALGLSTSELPRASGQNRPLARAITTAGDGGPEPAESADAPLGSEDFLLLDRYLRTGLFTSQIAGFEGLLDQADAQAAQDVLDLSLLGTGLLAAALSVRSRIGVLDSVIHASTILQAIPRILEPEERLTNRPSLAAGNDALRVFDLETSVRVAEFKVAVWKGADGMRQRSVFADLVGLTLDESGRHRELYVMGSRPGHFLRTSKRKAAKTLEKSAMRLRAPGIIGPDMTVAQVTAASGVEIIDLTGIIPELAAWT